MEKYGELGRYNNEYKNVPETGRQAKTSLEHKLEHIVGMVCAGK